MYFECCGKTSGIRKTRKMKRTGTDFFLVSRCNEQIHSFFKDITAKLFFYHRNCSFLRCLQCCRGLVQFSALFCLPGWSSFKSVNPNPNPRHLEAPGGLVIEAGFGFLMVP